MKTKRLMVATATALFVLFCFQHVYAGNGCGCDGVGTPGYWKNHPEAWPVEEITIGGVTYSIAEAIERMNQPVSGNKANTMFNALVAAILNVESGCASGCVNGTIAAAEAWMIDFDEGGVRANSDAWQEDYVCDCGGECLYEELDDYNNGLLCAPSRD